MNKEYNPKGTNKVAFWKKLLKEKSPRLAIPLEARLCEDNLNEKESEELELREKLIRKEDKKRKKENFLKRTAKKGLIGLGILLTYLSTAKIYHEITNEIPEWAKPAIYVQEGLNPLSQNADKIFLSEEIGVTNADELSKYDVNDVLKLRNNCFNEKNFISILKNCNIEDAITLKQKGITEELIPQITKKYSLENIDELLQKFSEEELLKLNIPETRLLKETKELEQKGITEYLEFFKKNYNMNLIEQIEKAMDPGTKEDYKSEYSEEEIEQFIEKTKKENIKTINTLIKYCKTSTVQEAVENTQSKNKTSSKIDLNTLELISSECKEQTEKFIPKIRKYQKDHNVTINRSIDLLKRNVNPEDYPEYKKIEDKIYLINELNWKTIKKYESIPDYPLEISNAITEVLVEKKEFSGDDLISFFNHDSFKQTIMADKETAIALTKIIQDYNKKEDIHEIIKLFTSEEYQELLLTNSKSASDIIDTFKFFPSIKTTYLKIKTITCDKYKNIIKKDEELSELMNDAIIYFHCDYLDQQKMNLVLDYFNHEKFEVIKTYDKKITKHITSLVTTEHISTKRVENILEIFSSNDYATIQKNDPELAMKTIKDLKFFICYKAEAKKYLTDLLKKYEK